MNIFQTKKYLIFHTLPEVLSPEDLSGSASFL